MKVSEQLLISLQHLLNSFFDVLAKFLVYLDQIMVHGVKKFKIPP